MNPYTEVLFEEINGKDGDVGLMTLNRPAALNALNHSMILAMSSQLQYWETADHIKAVIIRAAEGRAFCAGGDLRATYQLLSTNPSAAIAFFRDEYQLNKRIYHYSKPYIALLDGITMGGGVGISIHGSHRIATDKLLFAMPETGIGFFPDVGGTYFLPRLKGMIGYYIGLTGARLQSDDCVELGITQYKVTSNDLSELMTAIAQEKFNENADLTVSKVIEQFKLATNSRFLQQQTKIDEAFSEKTIEDILANLQQSSHSCLQEAKKMLMKNSPISLKVTLRALQQGKNLDFDACMEQEYKLSGHFLKSHDFREGIRAILIDKDQKPNWIPNSIKEVSDQVIDQYFMSIPEASF